MAVLSQDHTGGQDRAPFRPGGDVLDAPDAGREPGASTRGTRFEYTVRVDTAGISRLYPKVRKALLGDGYELTETVGVMRVLERLIATSIDRGAKRLQVRVHTMARRTHLKVIDRRRLNPRAALPSDVVPREIARASGARPASSGTGLELWSIVDRHTGDGPPAA